MLKLIKQHDERDCGASCLAMIASYYGYENTIQKYRALTKTDRNGANLYGLVDAATQIGMIAEAQSGSFDEFSDELKNNKIIFPFIALIVAEAGRGHFVVIKSFKNGFFTIFDPARGQFKISISDFKDIWTGYIVSMQPGKNFKKGNFKKGGFRKFFSLLRGQYKRLIMILIASLIISGIGISGSFVFKVVMDSFLEQNIHNEESFHESHDETMHAHAIKPEKSKIQNTNILFKLINFVRDNSSHFHIFFLMLLILYILQTFIRFFRGFLMSELSRSIDIKLTMQLFMHLVDLPVYDINNRNTGEYMSRFQDASTIRTAVSGATLTLLLDSLMVIACGVILSKINFILFLISLITIVIYAIVVLIFRKPLANVNREVMGNNAIMQSYMKESIDGIETIKSHQAEYTIKYKYIQKFKNYINLVFKNNVISLSQVSICDSVELIGILILLWFGFLLVSMNTITIGSLMTFYALLSFFITPIKNLIELQPMIQTAIIAADRLNDVLDIEIEKLETKKFDKEPLSFKSINFFNVDFRYGNRELTLINISFDIKKGEKVAIVGESGGGKTTLAKLLLRFYTPENGRIEIDNKDISQYEISLLRNEIGYVDQNTFIFSDTIKNNLTLGKSNATDEEIDRVCKLVKLDEFIKTCPFGYETFLDENGKNLSGGQRQRLAIARALLKKPKLIILDEATSNLDTITETAISESLSDLNEDMTFLIIAHRLSTIKKCNKIIVMDKGKIIECGSHEELLNKKGKYFELFSAQ